MALAGMRGVIFLKRWRGWLVGSSCNPAAIVAGCIPDFTTWTENAGSARTGVLTLADGTEPLPPSLGRVKHRGRHYRL